MAILLILSAIVIGNAAYEAGNISGAIMGTQATGVNLSFLGFDWMGVVIGLIAFILLYIGINPCICDF